MSNFEHMSGGLLELIIIFVLILLNGFFALSEMAVVSSRKPRLRHQAERGKKGYESVLKISEDLGPFLSTIQIGITLVGTIASAFGGATLARIIANAVQDVPFIGRYAQTVGLASVVILITFLSVTFGELAPKRIALNNPEHTAALIITPIRFFRIIFLPLVKILNFITDIILRLIGIRKSAEPSVTEDEVRIMIREGTRHGVFERSEQKMVEAVFYLGDRRAETFMTPRREIEWIELDDSETEIRRKIAENPGRFSFPVCRNGLDNIIGVVETRELLSALLNGSFSSIEAMVDEAVFVPENLHALKVLEAFRSRRTRVVFLVDEYGSVQGQVTVLDLMEEIIGELPGETAEEPEIVERGEGSYLVDGGINIDDFTEFFHRERDLPEQPGYHTLAGFIMDHLGAVPMTGDRLEWHGLSLEIVDMDGIRIDKVLVTTDGQPPEKNIGESYAPGPE